VLLNHGHRSPASDVPDYNAFVRVECARPEDDARTTATAGGTRATAVAD
jgi:hypothetical protein